MILVTHFQNLHQQRRLPSASVQNLHQQRRLPSASAGLEEFRFKWSYDFGAKAQCGLPSLVGWVTCPGQASSVGRSHRFLHPSKWQKRRCPRVPKKSPESPEHHWNSLASKLSNGMIWYASFPGLCLDFLDSLEVRWSQ